MTPYVTDDGAIQTLASLTPAGRQVLYGFLRACETLRPVSPSERIELGCIHFTRHDVIRMRLERRPCDSGRRIRSDILFETGARWKSGRLLIPGAALPEILSVATRGSMLERILDTPPVRGVTVRRCANLADGTLSVHCRIGMHEVPYEAPRSRNGRTTRLE
jgi:hypothetical protein